MADVPDYLLERSRDAFYKAKGRYRSDSPEVAVDERRDADEPIPETDPPAQEAAQPDATPLVATMPAVPEPMPTPVGEPGAAFEVKVFESEIPPPPAIYAPAAVISGRKRRGRGARVPGWLVPVYLLVPLLALSLAISLVQMSETESSASSGPDGAALYGANCAACHGADGGGGVGPALNRIPEVFPDPATVVAWVDGVASQTDGPYGESGGGNEGKGARAGAMPAFGGQLSPEEIRAIVAHELTEFSGVDPATLSPDFTGAGPESGGAGATGGGTTEPAAENSTASNTP